MEYSDMRSKKLVFMNHCLLNINSRGPGVAWRPGSTAEIVQIFLKNDIGIVQLPCCELLGWGGAARKEFDKFLPVISFSYRYRWLFNILTPVFKASLASYNKLCRKEALKVVERMKDYLQNGYTIHGVIGMNDSPTCSVTKKADMIAYMRNMAAAIEAGNTVDPVQMNLDILSDGKSFFMGNLIEEMRRAGLNIKVIGYDPWSRSQEAEFDRIASFFNL